MIRRYVFDPRQGRVVEVACNARSGPDAKEQYLNALGEYRAAPSDKLGQQLREATLERAGRREFAHKRLLNENRWTET